jgi:hypothetical protein
VDLGIFSLWVGEETPPAQHPGEHLDAVRNVPFLKTV